MLKAKLHPNREQQRYKTTAKSGKYQGQSITVYRYLLSGSPEELKKYVDALEAQGVNVHTDEETKQTIHFETTNKGSVIEVFVTSTGKIVTPNDELDDLQSLMRSTEDPTVKQELGKLIAQKMIANLGKSSASKVATEEETIVEEEDANLDGRSSKRADTHKGCLLLIGFPPC